MAAAAAMALWSCTGEPYGPDVLEKQYLAEQSAFVAPVLQEVGDVVADATTNSVEAVVFNWTKADFGAPVAIDYQVYATYGGNTSLLGSTTSQSFSITKSDFNGKVIKDLGITANESAQIGAYVEAYVSGTSAYTTGKSNVVNFNFQTFKASLRSLYICGQFQNSWEVATAPEFWETDGSSNTYKILIDYLAGGTIVPGEDQGFKILTQRAWSGDYWGYSGLHPDWTCPENSDANFQFGADAQNVYLLTVVRGSTTIDGTEYSGTVSATGMCAISLIGNQNGTAWDTDTDLVYDCVENVWSSPVVTFDAGAVFKIRGDHSWSSLDLGGATEASDVVDGGFNLVEGGSNITVSEAGSYIVRLYANRTPMVVKIEKQ